MTRAADQWLRDQAEAEAWLELYGDDDEEQWLAEMAEREAYWDEADERAAQYKADDEVDLTAGEVQQALADMGQMGGFHVVKESGKTEKIAGGEQSLVNLDPPDQEGQGARWYSDDDEGNAAPTSWHYTKTPYDLRGDSFGWGYGQNGELAWLQEHYNPETGEFERFCVEDGCESADIYARDRCKRHYDALAQREYRARKKAEAAATCQE